MKNDYGIVSQEVVREIPSVERAISPELKRLIDQLNNMAKGAILKMEFKDRAGIHAVAGKLKGLNKTGRIRISRMARRGSTLYVVVG